MTNRLVLLGTKGGPSLRKGGSMPSSSLLQIGGKSFVVDCGIGVARSLVTADLPLADIDGIFITHLHSDHLLELGGLIYSAWTSGLKKKITVYGPKGITGYWQGFMQAMAFDHAIRTMDDKRKPLTDLVEIVTYDEGLVTKIDDIQVTALRVHHPPIEDCFALRFAAFGKVVVFSGDTNYFPPLANFAKNADILIHEAMLGMGIDALVERMHGAPGLKNHLLKSHTMAEDVALIAQKAQVARLVINHLVPSDDPNISDLDWQKAIGAVWDGALTIGADGLEIAF